MKRLRSFFTELAARFLPAVRRAFDAERGVTVASRALDEARAHQFRYEADYLERLAELAEARLMAGTGPWRVSPQVITQTDQLIQAGVEALRGGRVGLKENVTPITAQGAFGDIELALQNVEWRREINLSWLEFSRWGIQQIILISRLYYMKNPLIQRGVNIASYYVFGRGVEMTSDDEDANAVIEECLEANQSVLGQEALMALEKRLFYDGQVFFAFFSDTTDKGTVRIRTFDATEIQDIVTDPDDTDQPHYYHRQWTQRSLDPVNGTVKTDSRFAWYPALGYNPTGADRLDKIKDEPVIWNTPVLHMKGGTGISKWHFDVPRVYAALDWARAAKSFLEACLTVRKSLATISMTLSTKGGQQALEGAKAQLQTHVNAQPGNALWDTNPTPVNASIFASGPGTKLEPFNTRGMGGDPEEVRQFKLMVAMVLDIPETFLADMNTSNLATAQTLDRPTELGFLAKQEAWRETLTTIMKYVLQVSKGAPSGKLSEAYRKRNVRFVEARRAVSKAHHSRFVYTTEAEKNGDVHLRVNFPEIREGDLPQLVTALVAAMTLNNKGGEVVGIDEKAGVMKLMELFGIENPEELLEQQYPEGEYDPDRTKEPEVPVPPLTVFNNPNIPQAPGNGNAPPNNPMQRPPIEKGMQEAIKQLLKRVMEPREPVNVVVEAAKPSEPRVRKVKRDKDGRILEEEDELLELGVL